MRTILLFCLTVIFVIKLTAQTQTAGPLSGNSFTIAAKSGSSQSWINVSNAATDDGVFATFGNLPDKTISFTNYLVITNFGFNIPGSTINGITVEIDRSDSNQLTSDYSIRIVKGGSITSTDRSTGIHYPAADAYHAYGGSSDLWGQTWQFTDINSANFGIAIAAQRNASGGITAGGIDNVRITVTYTLTILPLNLINFSATKNNKSILLSWVTSNETDMNHYEVERSSDGLNFNSIKSIVSINSMTETTYSYNDNNPLPGTSYYRLMMEGNSGYEKYSPIISIQSDNKNYFSLYPNPLTRGEKLYINNPDNNRLNIVFYDLSGKMAANLFTNSNLLSTTLLSGLKGEYVYCVYNSEGGIAGNGKIVLQ